VALVLVPGVGPAHRLDIIEQNWSGLSKVSVSVDHGVTELAADVGRFRRMRGGHASPFSGEGALDPGMIRPAPRKGNPRRRFSLTGFKAPSHA